MPPTSVTAVLARHRKSAAAPAPRTDTVSAGETAAAYAGATNESTYPKRTTALVA